jgi:hypothetical protein
MWAITAAAFDDAMEARNSFVPILPYTAATGHLAAICLLYALNARLMDQETSTNVVSPVAAPFPPTPEILPSLSQSSYY